MWITATNAQSRTARRTAGAQASSTGESIPLALPETQPPGRRDRRIVAKTHSGVIPISTQRERTRSTSSKNRTRKTSARRGDGPADPRRSKRPTLHWAVYTLGAAGRPNQMQARFVSRFVSHLFRRLFVLVCPRQQQARIDAAMRARSWPLACRLLQKHRSFSTCRRLYFVMIELTESKNEKETRGVKRPSQFSPVGADMLRCACRSGRWRRERTLVRESAARDWATERPYAPRSLTHERVRILEKKGCERAQCLGNKRELQMDMPTHALRAST